MLRAGAPPDEPELPPDEPELSPDEPELSPDEPELPPDEPELPPDEPELSPDEPELSPDEPELSPDEPALPPDEPELPPDEPELSPDEPPPGVALSPVIALTFPVPALPLLTGTKSSCGTEGAAALCVACIPKGSKRASSFLPQAKKTSAVKTKPAWSSRRFMDNPPSSNSNIP